MGQGGQQWIGTLVSFGVLALVLGLRMRRMRQLRPLRVERLWMFPAFYAVIVIALYAVYPPQNLMIWIYALAALAVGLLLGWWRGKLMAIHVDPQTHEVKQQGSLAAMLFIFVLVAIRFGVRSYAEEEAGIDPTFALSLTDILLALGLGFVAAQRLEMAMRARELLAQARGKAS